MTTDALDPLIHAPARLRIVVTLATLPEGDTPSFTHLRQLVEADYVMTVKTGHVIWSLTTAALTNRGRAALDAYAAALRDLLGGL